MKDIIPGIIFICTIGFIIFIITLPLDKGEYIDTEKLISIEEIPTSFNDIIRSKVQTDKGTYYIQGLLSAKNNADVKIFRFYLCIEEKCKKIY